MSKPSNMAPTTFSYMHSALQLERSINGYGLIVRNKEVEEGEIVIAWTGRIMTYKEILTLPEFDRDFYYQIDDDLFQVPFSIGLREPADFVNHSCEPTCGLKGPAILVAMRKLKIGEEVCFDYAMSESKDYHEIDCNCRTPSCRSRISGEDWKTQDHLWEKYGDFFSPYIKEKRQKYLATKQANQQHQN